MISNEHPVLQRLREAVYEFHLIGSRYVGPHDPDKADHDYIMVCDDWYSTPGAREWLGSAGFKPQGEGLGYGPDRRLHGSCVWTSTTHGEFPKVDLLPMSSSEALLRLKFFALMKGQGAEAGGWLAKALKSENPAWPTLWDCLDNWGADPMQENGR